MGFAPGGGRRGGGRQIGAGLVEAAAVAVAGGEEDVGDGQQAGVLRDPRDPAPPDRDAARGAGAGRDHALLHPHERGRRPVALARVEELADGALRLGEARLVLRAGQQERGVGEHEPRALLPDGARDLVEPLGEGLGLLGPRASTRPSARARPPPPRGRRCGRGGRPRRRGLPASDHHVAARRCCCASAPGSRSATWRRRKSRKRWW